MFEPLHRLTGRLFVIASVLSAAASIALCIGLTVAFESIFQTQADIEQTQLALCHVVGDRAKQSQADGLELYRIEEALYKQDSLPVHLARMAVYLKQSQAIYGLEPFCKSLP